MAHEYAILVKARFDPLDQHTFREPGVFTAGVHGPGAQARTLAYPPPSTLAGSLAGTLISSLGEEPPASLVCKGDRRPCETDYALLLEHLLARLLEKQGIIQVRQGQAAGERVSLGEGGLYAGLARLEWAGVKWLYVHYPPNLYLRHLPEATNGNSQGSFLQELLSKLLGELIERRNGDTRLLDETRYTRVASLVSREIGEHVTPLPLATLEPPKVLRVVPRARVGIALQRHTKTVQPHLLYLLSRIDPQQTRLTYLLLASLRVGHQLRNPTQLEKSTSTSLGTKHAPALLHLQIRGGEESTLLDLLFPNHHELGDNTRLDCLLYLAAPALLDMSPWHGQPIALSKEHLKRLAALILEDPLGPDDTPDATIIHLPEAPAGLETLSPGIESRNRPRLRTPQLHIPPGTIIHLTNTYKNKVKRAILQGLGSQKYARQGWGTTIAYCRHY